MTTNENKDIIWESQTVIAKKKHLKIWDRLFSECKREHYLFIGCDWDHISLLSCDYQSNIEKGALITIYSVRDFAWEFLHKSPLDEKNVYNLINLDWTLNFTWDIK